MRDALRVLLMVVLVTPGCADAEKPSQQVGFNQSKQVLVANQTGNHPAPITDDEARQFGRDFEAAVYARHQGTVDGMVALDDIVARSSEGLNIGKRAELTLRKEAGISLTRRWFNDILLGGKFRLASVRNASDGPKVLMRFEPARGGVSYFDFWLSRNPQGRITAHEVQLLSVGESLTALLRRGLIIGSLKSVTAEEHLIAEHAETVRLMMAAIRLPANPLAHFQNLPDELQKHSVFHVMVLSALRELKAPEFVAELERFVETHQGTAVDLNAIDLYVHRNDATQLETVIARLKRDLNDPWLDVLHAMSLADMGRHDEVDVKIDEAIANNPKDRSLFALGIELSRKAKDFERLRDWWKRLSVKTKADLDLCVVANDRAHAGFVASTEFAELAEWTMRGTPVTEDEATQFARELEELGRARNFEGLRDKLGTKALTNHTVFSIRGPIEKARHDLERRELLLLGAFSVFEEAGGRLDFIRVLPDNESGAMKILLRVINPRLPVNYHLLTIAKTPGSRIRMVEHELVSEGLPLTTAIRNRFAASVPEGRRNRLTQAERVRARESQAIDLFEKMRSLSNFDSVPLLLKEEKPILLRALELATLDKDRFTNLLQHIAQRFPDDHAVELRIIQGVFPGVSEEDRETAFHRFSQWTEDPYIEVVFARQALNQKTDEKFLQRLNDGIAKYPDSTLLYWEKVTHFVKRKRYAVAVNVLNELRQRPGMSLGPDLVKQTAGYKDTPRPDLDEFVEWCRQSSTTSVGESLR